MKILNQNLQEGQAAAEPALSKGASSKVVTKSQTKVQTKSTAVIPSVIDTNKPRTTIKFSFTMDSFVIDLMNTVAVSIEYILLFGDFINRCMFILPLNF